MSGTKQALLNALLQSRGQNFSGQALADQLGISRTAVNKAASALKKEGWQITASPRNGYRLDPGSDALTREAVAAAMPEGISLPDIVVFSTTGSTNEEAKRLAAQGAAHGTLVVASRQTAGKGRLGRSFESPEGKGVYLSLLLRPEMPAERAAAVTGSAAVAVLRAVRQLCGLELGIKWVNDLYLDGKKVCGILTEAVAGFESRRIEYLVCGIGLNISTTPEEFGPELAGTATSLYPDGRSPVSRAALAAVISAELYKMCPEFDYLEEYRKACFVPGHWVTVQAAGRETYVAKAIDIDAQGRLIVMTGKGRVALNCGEVTIRSAPYVPVQNRGSGRLHLQLDRHQ